ncbi:adenylate/guanylate cyclase domain-containing protein [Geofilum rubicundum]|uniref:Adenylate cyclase n=1 Tax=Geofilum rubicundum JCM 15548 TaxID=1236989 RepID=A0A0E9M321_9BACT|nr:adenylate/guanylate cyclase domain-containing protein [Geofilum rubicundum]GAO31565.1 adenylate cyclase [Geofilum rubicundum JCM 15548]
MNEPESYIDRIQRLASHNKELKSQLDEMVKRFVNVENQNQYFQEALLRYAPELDMSSKENRRLIKRLKTVSILYVSVKGFERLYQLEKPEVMVDLLDELNLALDDIAFVYNVVKLKSVGDTMLFAAGLQGENRTNPIDIVRVALDMQEAANKLRTPDGGVFWQLKMGIHTGPVVATPKNNNKSSGYNFSGDSINIACRLGEASPESTISVSVMTYELIKEFFESEPIGKMPVKYKGNLGMFQVKGFLPEMQDEGHASETNHTYRIKYLMLKFMDIQEEMLDYLEHKLPGNLYYHNIKHTIDVTTEVELIGWAEGVSEEEVLLLKLAALFHDAGHTISYKDHEYYGTVMAREKLASYDFTGEQIDTVCRLIMATQMPPQPKDLLECIICDSDLDYLGRTDFIPVSNALFKELKEHQMVESWEAWNKMQLKFIGQHQYFTKTALQLREVNKQQQIERLEQVIKEGVIE